MPIHGLTENVRLVRIGRFRLGFKTRRQGKEFPQAVPWFIPDVKDGVDLDALYAALEPYNPHVETWDVDKWSVKRKGDKMVGPTVIPVSLPIEDSFPWDNIFPQYLKCYRAGGLICKGDGRNVLYRVDTDDGHVCSAEELDNLECNRERCPKFTPPPESGLKPQCAFVGTFHFLLRGYPGFESFVFETSSPNSIKNINTSLLMLKGMFGKLLGLPALLTVTLENFEVQGQSRQAPIVTMSLDPKAEHIDPVATKQFLAMKEEQEAEEPPQPVDFYPDEAPVEEEPPARMFQCFHPDCDKELSSAEVDACVARAQDKGIIVPVEADYYCKEHLTALMEAQGESDE